MHEHQIELMQHALGINMRQREPYRNYFLASEGSPENGDWQELMLEGYATSHPAPEWSCGDVLYRVTDKGEDVAIAALPAPKRETEYDRYLDADCCHSFSEWLGIRLPEVEYDRDGKCRMFRRSRCYWDTYRDVEGEWCKTKKAAKTSYKEALHRSKDGE